ncbi:MULTISPECIES: glycoside hydrolase family 32 protein [unclassified Corynebacterium]|uniref:glycoside hydrolase family 32 protein n=1 Tax=unclassified Corynebacterium TaxID=2624378 RepID=UPI003F8DF506
MQHPRPRHHLTPPTGRLNDPNGMYLDGDVLHVYYQHDPGFPEAPKRTGWGHATTSLTGEGRGVWHHLPDALYPDASYDRDGCYSGSAVVVDDRVRLFYTGNLKVEGQRLPTQNLVEVDHPDGPEGGFHHRSPSNPVIDGPEEGYTGHFRDPQITAEPGTSGEWRMLLGAQREDGTGAVVRYSSTDLEKWCFDGEIEFDTSQAMPGDSPDVIPGGYMWECPNLLTLQDSGTGERLDVLVFCPQGLEPVTVDGVTHYASSDQCGYLVGRMRGTTFEVVRGFSELDHGHEFYAPQAVVTTEGDRAVLVGWMGLPGQDDQPTLADGWVHCLTVPRVLRLCDRGLYQELFLPPQDTEPDGTFGRTTTLRRQLGTTPAHLRVDTGPTSGVEILWEPGHLTVARGDDTRTMACPPGELTVLVDASTVELTAGGGAVACALRSFPEPASRPVS